MRVSWELEGRTPPWHCSPWTLSPRTARKAGIRAPFYIRESPGGEVGIALVYSKRADTGAVGVSYS